MYGQGYVGTSQDVNRIRRQEKQREAERKKHEELQQQQRAMVESAGLKQFGTSTTEALDNMFKNETVGLVTREEFMQKRATLQERLEEEVLRRKREDQEAKRKEKEARRKEKSRAAAKAKLSFLAECFAMKYLGTAIKGGEKKSGDRTFATPLKGEGYPPGCSRPGGSNSKDDEDLASPRADTPRAETPRTQGPTEDGEPSRKKAKCSKLGKDPSVPTDFLPDKDRELEEEELRSKLKKEWQVQQEKIKNEPVEITFSYWDGQGHRRKVTVRKGDSIGTFLKAVRDQLCNEFRELRAVSIDNLMYIKEDLIMPHHHTFYELIISKARGKSGPLFNFSVHEDVRVVNDATQEKQDSHAGKVVERHWYDKNKHIFPASRWEVYDPDKTYDKYTIYG